MKPTTAQMQTWFNEFNFQVFEGKLPIVPILFDNTYRRLGQFNPCNGRKVIKISLYYDRTKDQYRNCLLHEMCHLYCYEQGWVREHHGARWKAIAAKATRITGLKIQRCENTTGWKVADENIGKEMRKQAKKEKPAMIVVLHNESTNEYFLIKTTQKVIDAELPYYTSLMARWKVIGIYVTDSTMFRKWQTSRSLHRGYKRSTYDYNNNYKPVLDNATQMQILSARRVSLA